MILIIIDYILCKLPASCMIYIYATVLNLLTYFLILYWSVLNVYVYCLIVCLHAWITTLWFCTRVLACARHSDSFYVHVRLLSDNPWFACSDLRARNENVEDPFMEDHVFLVECRICRSSFPLCLLLSGSWDFFCCLWASVSFSIL